MTRRRTFLEGARNKKTKRDPHDRYETPPYVTRALLRHVRFTGSVLEPAAGTGRIVRVLRDRGYRVLARDIQTGDDFLERTHPCDNVCSNPPYRGTLPEQFARQALKLTRRRGTVALLLKHGFLWSNGRHDWLNSELGHPTCLIFMTKRIKFLLPSGKPIKGQFFDHVWVVWEKDRMKSCFMGAEMRVYFETDDGRG